MIPREQALAAAERGGEAATARASAPLQPQLTTLWSREHAMRQHEENNAP